MLKYKFLNNQVNNLSIQLNTDIDYVNDITLNENDNLIENTITDLEIKKYSLNNRYFLNLLFFDGSSYDTKFVNAGFTTEEINISNRNYRFSYVLMQVFDGVESQKQNLLHSSYIPIYSFPNKFNSTFDINPINKYYEFNNIYLANSLTLENNTRLFVNFKFYNAKTGNLLIMTNQNKVSTKEDIFYFEIILNTVNNTYNFVNTNVVCREYVDTTFVNKINELDKNENKSPIYPTGDLFDVNGNYLN